MKQKKPKAEILVVDLDHTLVNTDLLFETFWNASSKNWRTPISSILHARLGVQHLKRHLHNNSNVDVKTLPYNLEVLEYIRHHKEQGGKVALVTATYHDLAIKIANYLNIFDDVYGTTDQINLKGSKKAEFLKKRYGIEKFDYIGDSHSDMQVWKFAKNVIVVGNSNKLRKRVQELNKPTIYLQANKPKLHHYVRAFRLHQWLKNTLVFLPIISAHTLNMESITTAFIAFMAFSVIASSVYILNDLLDLKSDRAHPRKRYRPFAAGSIPIRVGSVLSLIFIFIGVIISLTISKDFLFLMILYFSLTSVYSLSLKRKLLIDILVLSILYTMRSFAGGIATLTDISVWLIAFSLFFFMSLACIKRQAELFDMQKEGRMLNSGRGYIVDDLPVIRTISLVSGYISVLVFALYLNSSEVQKLYKDIYYLWGICLILLYWISRLAILTNRGEMHDDPIVFAIKDKASLVCLVIIVLFGIVGANGCCSIN